MATAKQIAARKRFAALAKSGALAKMRKKNPAKKSLPNPAPKKPASQRTARGGCNPVYKVQVKTSKGYKTLTSETSMEAAESTARAIHALAPTKTLRVDGPKR